MGTAAIIAKLLQAGTRQGQKAAAALFRMLKKANPATLEKNVYKEYGNLGRKGLSGNILGPRALVKKVGMERRGHGFPKGYKTKDTVPGVKAFNPERGMSTRAIAERAAFDRLKTPPAMRGESTNMRKFRHHEKQARGPRSMDELKKKDVLKKLRELIRRNS